MELTPNAGLKKPGYSDTVDITDLNDNFDTVDGHIGSIVTSTGGVHGIRYNGMSQMLERFDADSEEWVTIGAIKEISAVLSANGWTNNSQTISVSGVTADSCGSVAPAQNISAEQISALCDAMLHVTGQADGTITVAAFQEVPTVDIPVVVTISGRAEAV